MRPHSTRCRFGRSLFAMLRRLHPRDLLICVVAMGAACSAAEARVPDRTSVPAQQSIESAALALKPGQYLWRDTGGDGAVTLVVSVPLQRVYVYRADGLVGAAAISTGRAGHRTPVGDFEVLQKREFHRSNIYSNAPMPHMQRLTWDGIALHGGNNPGYPASHGCIRLPPAFAALLFRATSIGTLVAVVEDDVVAPPPPGERFVPELPAYPELFDAAEFERVSLGSRSEGSRSSGTPMRDTSLSVPSATLPPPSSR